MVKNIRSLLALALALVAVIAIAPHSATATVYECKTDEAFEWNDGALKHRPFWQNTLPKNVRPYQPLLRFDDKTSTIWVAQSAEDLFNPTPAQIQVPIGPNNDLVVAGKTTVTTPEKKEMFSSDTLLRIRGWAFVDGFKTKTAPLSFFFYDGSTNFILTGGCTTTEKSSLVPPG